MAIARGHTLLLLMAVTASAQDDTVPLVQTAQAARQPFRTEQEVEQAPPRRIQYLFDAKAGLGDRIHSFTFVNNLARVHNATAYIPGGRFSAKHQLATKHSPVIAEDWGVYFDLTAENGNPFHEADLNMTDCFTIPGHGRDWYHLFDDGGHCVNIRLNLHAKGLPPELFDRKASPKPSPNASWIVDQALEQAGVRPFEFGYLHIRRCDRLSTNAVCTDPTNVTQFVATMNQTAWLVFTYAEIGYLPVLKDHLKALAPQKRFVYEEDLHLDAGGDNYLLYIAMLALRDKAGDLVDTHVCRRDQGPEQPPLPEEVLATPLEEELLNLPPLEEELLKHECGSTGEAHGPYTIGFSDDDA